MVKCKTPSFFPAQDFVKVSSGFCCSFQDYLEQLKKKRKILRDWVHTLVIRGNLKNFYTVLCRKYEGVFALYCMKFDLI